MGMATYGQDKIRAESDLGKLISSIDATYLSIPFTSYSFDDFAKAILKYQFNNVCTFPRISKLLPTYKIDETSGYNIIGVFNFPDGLHSGISISDELNRFKNDIQEIDIVAPPHNFMFQSFKNILHSIKLEPLQYKVSKVIIESYLQDYNPVYFREICQICIDCNVDFIKTNTGFSKSEYCKANIDDIKRIKDIVGDSIKIKASGGIKTLDQLEKLRESGVERFGISIDNAVKIIDEFNSRRKK